MSKTSKTFIDIKGVQELEKKIEELRGGKKTSSIMNRAINNATEKVANNLKSDMEYFKDKGATVDEVVHTMARLARKEKNGRWTKIGWNGPYDRYKLVHLNEFGYQKNGKRYNPRGMGAIDKSISRSTPEFVSSVENDLKKELL